MRTLLRLLSLSLAVLPLLGATSSDSVFENQILPILTANCASCHGTQPPPAGISLDSRVSLLGNSPRGPLVKPGDPDHSLLIQVLKGTESPRMPYGKPPLSPEKIEVIAGWIASLKPDASAPVQKWWAFQAPVKSVPPEPHQRDWAVNDIDKFVLSKLEEKGLSPSGIGSRVILLRRAYFDLVGEPPTPEEAERFLSDNKSNAYALLVDRLLADPRFGERWGEHWLDLARYADTEGFEPDRESYHMWRYRDYVIDSFNKDKPYDQFIREQLAGDEIVPRSGEATIATGFLRLGPRFQNTNAGELRQMTLDEITGTVGSAFLAVTVKCAQCHDHRYDPIPQKDFYRMEAFFTPLVMTSSNVDFADATLKTRMKAAQDETEARLETAQQAFHAYQKQLLAKLAASGVKLTPAKATEPADAQKTANQDAFVREKTPDVVELERHITRSIANAAVPNDEDKTFTLEEKKRYLYLLGFVDGNMGGRDLGTIQRELRRYAPRAEVVEDAPNDANRPTIPVTFVRLHGDFNRPGEWVAPGYPSALTGTEDPATLLTDTFGNPRAWRTPLANWIASPENSLTARVMVNRIWQHLFGTPIVDSPSNFGRNGALPSNQKLLDWLAVTFTENKWSVKSMIRLIMLSSTYRQTSLHNAPNAEAADPDNRLLWRQNRKRLEGDIIRDTILTASGRLNPDRGGPGVFPRLPAALKDEMTIKNLPAWTPSDGPETRKRSIYIFRRRQREFPLLSVMDAPVFQASCERRTVSTTALQALTLLNDDFVNQEVRYFAERVRREAGSDPSNQIRRAFAIALTRPPDAEELRRFLAYLSTTNTTPASTSGLEGGCRVLLNTNEFVYVD